MAHDVTEASVTHQYLNASEEIIHVFEDFVIIILRQLISAEQIELGCFRWAMALPDLQFALYEVTILPLVKGEDEITMITTFTQHLGSGVINNTFIQALTELEWLLCVDELLEQFLPILVAEEIVIPQINVRT